MTLKYSEVAGYDAEAVAAANRAYDARTGFNVKFPGDGAPRLQYPPYVPALPSFEIPPAGPATKAMSAAIFAWNERWVQSRCERGTSLS